MVVAGKIGYAYPRHHQAAPLELFLEQEQEALQALPYHPYDSSEVAFAGL